MSEITAEQLEAPTQERRKTSSAVHLWVLLLVGQVWTSFTSCLCGYSTGIATIVIIPVVALGSYQFFARNRMTPSEQILGCFAYAFILRLLVKNMGDIFFWGHDPLLVGLTLAKQFS